MAIHICFTNNPIITLQSTDVDTIHQFTSDVTFIITVWVSFEIT